MLSVEPLTTQFEETIALGKTVTDFGLTRTKK